MKKKNFPHKLCKACGKTMSWRRKWSKVWDEVKYCSERCRRKRNVGSTDTSQTKTAPKVVKA